MESNFILKLKIVGVVVAMLVLLGLAGRCDYTEEVLYEMPSGTYEYMKHTLDNVDDYEIARLYAGREQYWDELAIERGY